MRNLTSLIGGGKGRLRVIKDCNEENGFSKGLNDTGLINHKERIENNHIIVKDLKAIKMRYRWLIVVTENRRLKIIPSLFIYNVTWKLHLVHM